MIINDKFFKKYSPIPLNFDSTELRNYITVAQEIWVRPLIGSDFLDELEEQVAANEVSDENATLLTDGFLWQYLSYATCLEGLPIIWTHFSEVGITLGKSENSESVTLKDLTYVQQHLRNQVEVLKDSVKRFICEHYQSFPKANYCACGCSCCQENTKLNKPNPLQELYTTRRRNTNIR